MGRIGVSRLSLPRLILAIVAVALIALCWRQVLAARRGLTSRSMQVDGMPMTFLAPTGATNAPGVLIAHGFSGSQQLMLGYGHVLAQAGYGVLLWDFAGHGSNGNPLDREGNALQADIDAAYAALLEQPEIDAGRVALLGHSMGSGAVMTAGIEDNGRYSAVVAISPTDAAVTPERPPNLLLQAGSLEPRFVANARDLLARAGGPNDDFDAGLARDFVLVPGVEHITILFSRTSHQAALDWFNRVFGRAMAVPYRDLRVIWYGLHLGAWLLLIVALAPLFPTADAQAGKSRPLWRWLGLPLGALSASLSLALLGRFVDVASLGGLLVGGALGVWFLVMGGVWLALGFRPPAPTGRDLLYGLLLFGLLWLAFGAMAQLVWLPWLLIPERLLRWPFLAAAALPWLLATGLAVQRQSLLRRAGWWLLETTVLVAGLGLAVLLSPGLFFVLLLIPVMPVVLGVMFIAGAAVDRPWSFALGNALFFGWLIAAVFSLAR